MVSRPIIRRTILKKSKEYKDIICIPQWTKHHIGMEDSLEGQPAELNEVFKHAGKDKIESCYVQKVFHKIVVKLRNGTWYETPESNLEQLTRDRLEVTPTQAMIFNEALKRSEQLKCERECQSEEPNVIRKKEHANTEHEDYESQAWIGGNYTSEW